MLSAMDDKPSATMTAVPLGVLACGLTAFIQGEWTWLTVGIGVGVGIVVLLIMMAVRNA